MGSDKISKKGRQEELDDFWDLSDLVPVTKASSSFSVRNTNCVEVRSNALPDTSSIASNDDASSTVIKRYINPLHDEQKKIRRESYESTCTYYPENSLLHEVTLKKRRSEYELYSSFADAAKEYRVCVGERCKFVPYYSYVPQYDQLSKQQLAYYLWWRTCFEKGELIDIDYSYVLLYVYEIINLGKDQDITAAQKHLCDIWKSYYKKFPAIATKLALWICDFSLLHKLPVPTYADAAIGKYAPALKEFYLNIPKDDYKACTESLIKYGTEYDYRSSKFYTDPNKPIFDKHIYGAVEAAVRFYSDDGVMLSRLYSEDSKLFRNLFEGALCCSAQRFDLEVKYCSFSRSNEMRFLFADIMKYAENKIRTYIGVKSKLTVYSVSADLQKVIDEYFENVLMNTPRPLKKKEEKHDYDELYELREQGFSIEKAKQIEKESWSVTKELISAFEDVNSQSSDSDCAAEKADIQREVSSIFLQKESKPEDALAGNICGNNANVEGGMSNAFEEKLGKYMPFLKALIENDFLTAAKISNSLGEMSDTIVDRINEIAVEEIGDILIEESEIGDYAVLEYYRDFFIP